MDYLIGLLKYRCCNDEPVVNTDIFTRLSAFQRQPQTGREKMSCMGKTRVVNGNRICFLGSETAAIRLTCLIWSEMSHSDLSFRWISCGRPFQTNMPCYPLKGGMPLTVVILWWSTNTFANVNWGDNLSSQLKYKNFVFQL